MSNADVKPCPFCGGEAKFKSDWIANIAKGIKVKCEKCGANIPYVEFDGPCNEAANESQGYEIAAQRWNRRVTDENA